MLNFDHAKNVVRMLNNYSYRMDNVFISIIGYVNNNNAGKIKNEMAAVALAVRELNGKIFKNLELFLLDKETEVFSEKEKHLILKAFNNEQEILSDKSKNREIFGLEIWEVFDEINKEQSKNAESYLELTNYLLSKKE